MIENETESQRIPWNQGPVLLPVGLTWSGQGLGRGPRKDRRGFCAAPWSLLGFYWWLYHNRNEKSELAFLRQENAVIL